MNALVVGAAVRPGHADFYRRLLRIHDFVVGADAGAEACAALGRVPDVAVGDFDSAAPGAAERLAAGGARVIQLPERKDVSDLDAAVGVCAEAGATALTVTGAFSLRLDHTLSALGSLARAASLAPVGVEPDLAVWALDGSATPRLDLTGRPGLLVSLMSPTGAEGVCTEGLSYPLSDARLEALSSHGLSNELARREASVTVRSGCLLVLAPGDRSRACVERA